MTEPLDGPRGATQARPRAKEEDVATALAAHLGEGHALRHDPPALAALMAGIAAAPEPEGADETWMDLIVPAPRAPAPNEVSVYRTSIKLRNERHDLVVSLYDVASGKILASKVEVPER